MGKIENPQPTVNDLFDDEDLRPFDDETPGAPEAEIVAIFHNLTPLDDVRHLIDAGAALHWLKPREKRPIEDSWSTAPLATFEELERKYQPGYNIGVRLGEPSKIGDEYQHLIDLDVRDEEKIDEAVAALLRFLPEAARLPRVISGSGGSSRHFYFTCSTAFGSRKLEHSKEKIVGADGKYHWSWEIELFGTGKQAVLPPSIHPDTGKEYTWERSWKPVSIPAERVEGWGASSATPLEDGDLETIVNMQPLTDLPVEKIQATLAALPLDKWCVDRQGWLNVGMALHHQFQGSAEGYELWEKFSKRAPKKYRAADQKRTWKSFGPKPRPIRFNTLIKAANEALKERGEEPIKVETRAAVAVHSITAAALQNKTFAPLKFAVPGILVEGLSMLAARPKYGKSWSALDMALAVSTGGLAFGSIECEPGDVLYAALEDNERRLASRLEKLVPAGSTWPERLTFWLSIPRLNKGGVEKIANWIESVQRPRLVIVDTLQAARDEGSANSTTYANDYNSVQWLQRMVMAKRAAGLILHHDRKMGADDPFDTISGTLGLTGALDALLVMRTNTQGQKNLYGKGRDIQEFAKAIEFRPDSCRWEILGDTYAVGRSEKQNVILDAIRMRPGSTPKEIAEIVSKSANAVKLMLGDMGRGGLIRSEGGHYYAVNFSDAFDDLL